jgi:hypothetical protein
MFLLLSISFAYILIGGFIAAVHARHLTVSNLDDKYAMVLLWPFFLIGVIFKWGVVFLVDVIFERVVDWVIKKSNQYYDNLKKNRVINKVIDRQ